MTNYEAIMDHREEFKEWVNSKGGIDGTGEEEILATVLDQLMVCHECPYLAKCLSGSPTTCRINMKELLDDEYRGEQK